ncbi:unnamed protein product [Cuscuta campestris]|uniref:Uncharacterized protein n=1 Tax=Cuscuta campestris TaxID=132261 RepID=A0A484MQN0_9ASTE|nr:unnamed protein product [Cuscuta campestris]
MMEGMPTVVGLAANPGDKSTDGGGKGWASCDGGAREDGRSTGGEGVVVGLKLTTGVGEGQNQGLPASSFFTSLSRAF